MSHCRTVSKRSLLGSRPRHSPLSATGVRGDNDAILSVEVLPDVAEKGRLGVQVVNGDAEEACQDC